MILTDLTNLALNRLHFTEENGLVFCKNGAKYKSEILLIDEAEKLGADAVFFRRYFRDKETEPYKSEPLVYIFQKSDTYFNSKENKELHAKLWSAGRADIYIIFGETQINIINARRPAKPEEGKNKNDFDLESLKLANGAIEEINIELFSAHLFERGIFWEQEGFELDENQTPFKILLDCLEITRENLQRKHQSNKTRLALDNLLLLSILIMFLEEKKDETGKFALMEKYEDYYKRYKVNSFSEILRKKYLNEDSKKEENLCVKFLNELANKYNGQIFNLTPQDESIIKEIDLSEIALFVEGKTHPESKQINIWRQYNFNYLPIELISSIYENFLQTEAKQKNQDKEKGVVYTPPFLVNFLIDEVMPLNLDKENYLKNGKIKYKILDPSCGSGIFLVGAYKRLLDWWRLNNQDNIHQKTKKVISEEFQEILESNIFGVDINNVATQISIFSLTIAFLDKIDPKLLWEEFQFKNLSVKNIKHKNFFEWANDNKTQTFDLVIGNPPFNVPTEYEKKEKEYVKKFINPFKEQIGIKYLEELPDNFPLYFLEFARVLCSNRNICLIIKSKFLYSSTIISFNYRKAVFENLNVEKIFDFTHLREILFTKSLKGESNKDDSDNKKSGRTPVCALIINNSESKFNSIEHTIVKRLTSSEKKLRFEIDHYDRHYVKHDWACTYSFIWKCNLLGGGRLFHLIYRLSLMQNLKQFINEKNKKYKQEIKDKLNNLMPQWTLALSNTEGAKQEDIKQKTQLFKKEFEETQDQWVFQTGYMIGQRKYHAPHIANKTIIKDIIETENGIKIIEDIETETHFEGKRTQWLFTPPFIAIKEIAKDKGFLMYYSNEYRPFEKGIVGIHAHSKDSKILAKIYNRLKNTENYKTYLLWVLTNSSAALAEQETSINKTDLETLPFPDFEEEEYLALTETERIVRDDVLKHYKHLGKSIKIGDDGYEPLEKKLNIAKPEDKQILEGFGNVFCDNLNEIYRKNNKSWQIGKIYQTQDANKLISENFIIYQLGFGVTSDSKKIPFDESQIENLIYDKWSNRGAVWVRTGRLYKHNEGYDCVFLIKPSNIRYWLRSVALRDADETFMDLKNAGL